MKLLLFTCSLTLAAVHANKNNSPLDRHILADQPAQNGSVPPEENPSIAPPPPYKHEDLQVLSGKITNILDSLKSDYDKRVRPNYGGKAVQVGVTLYVLSVFDVSEVNMDFTLDFYFRQTWNDPRLKFSGPEGVNTLSLSSEFLKSIWVPDTFFVNEKTSYFHTAATNNELVRISKDGDVLRSFRSTVRASCPMDLRFFPMDSQLCSLEMESFGHTMLDIRYNWARGVGSIGVGSDVILPHFMMLGYRPILTEISLSTGNYSRLACEFQFVRSMGYYLLQIYFPSALIVVISWVSFWLNRNAAFARVFLGVTTVLSMITLALFTNKDMPKISYLKAVDVYLGTCFVMVFAALLEYATVGYLAKQIQMRKNVRDEHVENQCLPTLQQQQQHSPSDDKIKKGISVNFSQIWGITPGDLDKYSRMVFPVCFVCFNLLYWIVYLRISNIEADTGLVLLNED